MIILFKIVRIVVIAYVCFGVLLYVFQRDFLYYPTDEVSHDFPVEQMSSDEQILKVITLNPNQPRAIIYFGGNGENIAHTATAFENIFPEHTVYLLNYRGYGGSSGTPSEQAFYTDAKRLYDLVAERHVGISVIGRSLGSGVATYLAANREPEKLVLVTPFDSVESLASQRYPLYPVSLLLKDKFLSVEWVRKIDTPTLILLAELDFVVPAEHSQRLIERFLEQLVTVKTFKGLSHNNISFLPEYNLEIKRFLDEATQVD